MTPAKLATKDRFTELLDRDLDRIIEGTLPANENLLPLQSFIKALTEFASVPASTGFITSHATEAADAAALRRHTTVNRAAPVSRRVIARVRQRIAAGATSLMMVIGMTGVAFAADTAVPGDWNYGIDRALEAVGIGAGGADERLQELAATHQDQPALALQPNDDAPRPAEVDSDNTGLQNASATVTEVTNGSEQANATRAAVAAMLDRISEGGISDGLTVGDLARLINQTHFEGPSNRADKGKAQDHRPAGTGKPETTGTPVRNGNPHP